MQGAVCAAPCIDIGPGVLFLKIHCVRALLLKWKLLSYEDEQMGFLNVEIKARCNDQDRIRGYLKDHGADFKGVDHQVDTYFNVAHGRMKLREGDIENYLVHYDRPDREGPKQTRVAIYRLGPNPSLKEVLTEALGILVVVDKRREIYFIDNVKFHIDLVDGLGTFMEIEAIDFDGSISHADLYEQCKHYLEELKIKRDDLVPLSYSDLIMRLADSNRV